MSIISIEVYSTPTNGTCRVLDALSHKRTKEKGTLAGVPDSVHVSVLKNYIYYNKSDTELQEKNDRKGRYFKGFRRVSTT